MVGRVVFLRLCLVGRDTNKKVTITRPKGSCRKSTDVMGAQRRGTKPGTVEMDPGGLPGRDDV